MITLVKTNQLFTRPKNKGNLQGKTVNSQFLFWRYFDPTNRRHLETSDDDKRTSLSNCASLWFNLTDINRLKRFIVQKTPNTKLENFLTKWWFPHQRVEL